jgi:hypothetical protein
MTYLILTACLVTAFSFITYIVVPYVTRPASLFEKGPAHARIKGVLICGISATALLFIINPDHLTEIKSRAWESLALAGFSAVFWLPWYLFVFGRAADKVRANTPKDRK